MVTCVQTVTCVILVFDRNSYQVLRFQFSSHEKLMILGALFRNVAPKKPTLKLPLVVRKAMNINILFYPLLINRNQ